MILLNRTQYIQFYLFGTLLLIAKSIAASSFSVNRNLEVSKPVRVLQIDEKENASFILESVSNQIVSKKYPNVSQNAQTEEEESISEQPSEEPIKNDSQGIFHVKFIFDIYKAISPIILRIIFGIALDETKMMEILKKPIGVVIAFFCIFIFMPLSNYIFGWMFFAGNADNRLSLFSSAVTRLKGVYSTCWIVVLNGNIELSVVMSIVITISFSVIPSQWLFAIGESLFNSDTSNGTLYHMKFNLYIYYIIWTLCSTIVPLLIGLCIQNIYPQSKEYAVKLVNRAVFSYILLNFVIMTVHDIVGWIHSDASFKLHLFELFLPILRYLFGFFVALAFKQKYEDSLAIAVESTVPRQNASTSLPMVIHFIFDKVRRKGKQVHKVNKSQMSDENAQPMYHVCSTDAPETTDLDMPE